MRKLIPAFAAALACAACAVPAFDPSASAAVAAIRLSHLIGVTYSTTGPDMDTNGEPDFDLKGDTLVFMPQRGDGTIDSINGFVVRRREWDSWNEIWYQWWDGSKVKWMGTPAGFDEEEGLRWRWPVSVKGGPYLGAIIFDWSDLDTYVERLYANTVVPDCDWNPAYGTYDPGIDIRNDLGFGSEPVIVGMSLNPLSGPDDRIHALVRIGASFSEAEANVSSLTLDPSFSASITVPNQYPLPFLGTPRHINYARDDGPAVRSFVQWMDEDTWHTWAWKGTIGTGFMEPPEEAVNLTHRIDAVLTTDPIWGWPVGSYLLSTEKQIGRVYYYNGIDTEALVAEFGLGTLHFIGQVMLNGEWQLIFTRSRIDHTTNPATIRFEVRGIYTKDLLEEFGL